MTRKFKTSKKNRNSYIYYQANSNGDSDLKIILTPGEDGVTETMIEILHGLDDEEFDNNRRTDEHRDLYYGGSSTEGENSPDALEQLPDDAPAIDERLDLEIRKQKLAQACAELTPEQQELVRRIYFNGESAVDISRERGVSKAAISQQLKRLLARLKKNLSADR